MRIVLFVILGMYFLGVNVHSYDEMRKDKEKAQQKQWRTPEKDLLFLAAIGGAAGEIVAMHDLFSDGGKHKIGKAGWRYGLNAILINHVLIVLLLIYLTKKAGPKARYLVARNAETGKLIYFKLGNVRRAKYVLGHLPDQLIIMNEFYLISSKDEKPWEIRKVEVGIRENRTY